MIVSVRTKADVFSALRKNGQRIRSFGVTRLGLFGSFKRDEPTETSDVDLLVEFEPGAKTFDNFIGLSDTLEELLHRRVELLTRESLSPYIGPRILEEVEDVPLDD